jgi:glycyl-tRNA synthetase
MVAIAMERKRVAVRPFVPNVIEPSFGIGRIITGVLEHNFTVRPGDEARGTCHAPASLPAVTDSALQPPPVPPLAPRVAAVFAFRPVVAPYKAVVLTLDGRIPSERVNAIATTLTTAGLAAIVDDSGASVGKRYARCDEVGIPFAVTVDFKSLDDDTVTLRERDTCAQIRLPAADLPAVIGALVNETRTWAAIMTAYPVVTTGEDKAATASTAAGGAGAASAPAAAAASALTPAPAPAAAAAAGGAGAAGAGASAAAGSVGVVREGADRLYGRFCRPAVAIPVKAAGGK